MYYRYDSRAEAFMKFGKLEPASIISSPDSSFRILIEKELVLPVGMHDYIGWFNGLYYHD